jgi:hypothetical protein
MVVIGYRGKCIFKKDAIPSGQFGFRVTILKVLFSIQIESLN